MVSKDFFNALNDLEEQKNINKEEFIQILESALTSAYKKNFGEARSAFVKLIPEKNTIKLYAYKSVVDEVEDPEKQISVADANAGLSRAKYKVGDLITEEVVPKEEFGRIAAQTAKHIIMQKIHEAEKEKLLQEMNGKENEIITGIINRKDEKNVYVEIAGSNIYGVLSNYDQIPNEKYNIGDKLKVFVKQIKDTPFGPQICLSRKAAGYVRRLLEIEVPEIESGEVEIKSIAREAGVRTKIAVASVNGTIDPVGACIGNKGARINTITAELGGEKIDVIEYSDDPFVYIARALSPATVKSVEIDELNHSAKVIVDKDKLSLAIGMNGHNVRLAAKLTGYKIDVKTEEQEVKDSMYNSGIADKLDENDFVLSDEDEFAFDEDSVEQEEQDVDEFDSSDFEVSFDDEK